METEFWKQSIIEVINKIDSKVSLMKIYYFVINVNNLNIILPTNHNILYF